MYNRTLFFESSQSITKRLGELFDFFWPAMAGLWNLRWQVHGFSNVTGKREALELYAKFVEGSGVTSANLKVACLETKWTEQKEQFARFLLVELCALYEGWLEDVVPRVVSTTHVKKVQDNLQFPSSTSPRKPGLAGAIAIINASPSSLLKTEFFPSLSANVRNSWVNRENLLHGYRYFKEIRNALIHRGGLATQTNLDTRAKFVSIPMMDLGLRKPPLAPAALLGQRLRLELSDMVGLSNIVHRLIVTFDAALAVSVKAEDELWERLHDSYFSTKAKGKHKPWSPDPKKREINLRSLLASAKLPYPVNISNLATLLPSHGVPWK